jgi:hypothetical protein
MTLRQIILCSVSGGVQRETKAFYIVALKFAGLSDYYILTEYDRPSQGFGSSSRH